MRNATPPLLSHYTLLIDSRATRASFPAPRHPPAPSPPHSSLSYTASGARADGEGPVLLTESDSVEAARGTADGRRVATAPPFPVAHPFSASLTYLLQGVLPLPAPMRSNSQ